MHCVYIMNFPRVYLLKSSIVKASWQWLARTLDLLLESVDREGALALLFRARVIRSLFI